MSKDRSLVASIWGQNLAMPHIQLLKLKSCPKTLPNVLHGVSWGYPTWYTIVVCVLDNN